MSRFLSLSALLLAIALLASRTGLVVHEIGGHWGPAAAFGCVIGEIRLFVFGGGWIDFSCADITRWQSMTIELGGIALELVLGTGLLFAARRRPHGMPALVLLCIGLLWILHALFYLVTGVHYGVGDGRSLHQLLEDRRAPLVFGGSAVLVAGCGIFATSLARRLADRLPTGSRFTRSIRLAAAIFVATGVHGALMWGEQRLRADPVYAASFTPEHESAIAAEVKRFEQAQPRTPAEVEVARREIAARRTPFPLRPILGAAMACAALAGLVRGVRRSPAAALGGKWNLF